MTPLIDHFQWRSYNLLDLGGEDAIANAEDGKGSVYQMSTDVNRIRIYELLYRCIA